MSGGVNDFLRMMYSAGKAHVKVQTAWARVKSVDWERKTMVATGVADDLDFYDVLLGLGNVFRKPAVGCKCLVGLIENNAAAAFLIDAEALDLLEYNQGGIQMEVDSLTNKISVRNGQVGLVDLFQALKDLILQLKVTTPAGPSTNLLPDSIVALEQFEIKFKQLLN